MGSGRSTPVTGAQMSRAAQPVQSLTLQKRGCSRQLTKLDEPRLHVPLSVQGGAEGLLSAFRHRCPSHVRFSFQSYIPKWVLSPPLSNLPGRPMALALKDFLLCLHGLPPSSRTADWRGREEKAQVPTASRVHPLAFPLPPLAPSPRGASRRGGLAA